MHVLAFSSGLTLPVVSAAVLQMPPPTTPQPQTDRPEVLKLANGEFHEALEKKEKGSFEKAKALYSHFLRNADEASAEHKAEAYFFLAQCEEKSGRPEQAIAAYKEIRKSEKLAKTEFGLHAAYASGKFFYQRGDYSEALIDFRAFVTNSQGQNTRPEMLHQVQAGICECLTRQKLYGEALKEYGNLLGGTASPQLKTFALHGMAFIAESTATAACDKNTPEPQREKLWKISREALDSLQKQAPKDAICADALRAVAGLAYDHANAEPQSVERWKGAQELFTRVHSLGQNSSHYNDALFFLGWSELRLGNFTKAQSHFSNLAQRTPQDSRHKEARELAVICQGEALLQPKAAAEKNRVASLSQLLVALAEVKEPSHASVIRSLSTRVARELLPVLPKEGAAEEFQKSHKAAKDVLGETAYATLVYNSGHKLLHPASGVPTAADRSLAIALFTEAAKNPQTRAGQLAAVEVARAQGNWKNLAEAASNLKDGLKTSNSTADQELSLFASSQQIFAQILIGDSKAAEANLVAAKTNNPGTYEKLLGATWGALLKHGNEIVSKEISTPTSLSAEQQREAGICFGFLIRSEDTRGQLVRAQAHLGQARLYQHVGDFQKARGVYELIPLVFSDNVFATVRMTAQEELKKLDKK